ncbi:M20 metallopeptidase family protein [Leifsonia poae]|uniref:M20 metallopeptidase family protein n=1 Tax=Leifsonia poae TaxID=110933 RepID=UPI001CBEB3C5|nr:M20 family metallopeptidase [Leifsonia poae]
MSGRTDTVTAETILPGLVALRREIHADPETGSQLPRTQARILTALRPLGLEITLGRGLSSIVAVLRGGRPGPAVLLRADMDALPLVEETGLDYAAQGDRMHACGHDLHVAALVGAATLLSAGRDSLAGDVVFMFQPAEEVGDGAKTMIEEGLLDILGRPPIAAYGIHVVPGEYGVFSTRPGTLMAGALEASVTVTGSGGHASAPHLATDPVPVVAEMIAALQTFATREFDVFDPVVVSVTQVHAGGQARNIIPDEARLGASIRVLSRANQERVARRLPVLLSAIAEAHGCRAAVTVDTLCPPTVNDDAAALLALDVLERMFGPERVRRSAAPVMGSEDFAFVLERVPGAFVFLRATPPHLDPDAVAPNHHSRAVFDDAVLADQALALAELARETLRRQEWVESA